MMLSKRPYCKSRTLYRETDYKEISRALEIMDELGYQMVNTNKLKLERRIKHKYEQIHEGSECGMMVAINNLDTIPMAMTKTTMMMMMKMLTRMIIG